MEYFTAAETAEKWGVTERTVRNYCRLGRVDGAFLDGKIWLIPRNAPKPERKPKSKKIPDDVLNRLKFEKENSVPGGIYHTVQIELTYNSNHIEGSRLTLDQTRAIFETNTLAEVREPILVDDIIETSNHFRCVDLIIEQASRPLSESLIKQLHRTLKSGTGDSRKGWFAVGDYKRLENEIGGKETASVKDTPREMKQLLSEYKVSGAKTLDDLLDFHVRFERIHPFQDGNGRIGRLILFKECLRFGIVPFVILDEIKWYYYRGLNEWTDERGYLRDTCLTAQEHFKKHLDYFKINW